MSERDDRSRTSGSAGTSDSTIENPGPMGTGHDTQSGQGTGGHQYDNDGLLAQQTPGLDPEAIRREAGPDWGEDVTTGDLESDDVEADGAESEAPRR